MRENVVRLWNTRDGRHCYVTKPDAGPPFEVLLSDGTATQILGSFDTHNSAVEFAVAEMQRLCPSEKPG